MKHGGLTDALRRRLGTGAEVVDVSVNVNPYGTPPEIVEAVRRAEIGEYPDPLGAAHRRALAASLDVPCERVVLGAGAVDLLWAAVRALCGRDRPLLVAEPTFSEARLAAAACGAPVHEWRASPDREFAWDLDDLAAAIAARRPAAVYLCTPQNPTGIALPVGDVVALCEAYRETTFLVDQSFLALSTRFADERVALPDNGIALRSLTKIHALPGLRLGYAVCAPWFGRAIDAQRPPWSVSAPALAAADVIARRPDLAVAARGRMLADARALAERLAEVSLPAVPSSTVYCLVDLGRPAPPVVARLLRDHRVLVRDATSFGLPTRIRLAARTEAHRRKAIAALKDVTRS